MKNLWMFLIITVSAFGCTQEYDTENFENFSATGKPLNLITKVLTTQSTNFIQEFKGSPVLGLQILSEKTGQVYKDNPAYKNVRSEAYQKNNTLNWRQMPEVLLDSEPANVYAYYPFQEQTNSDPDNIPVRISPDASLTINYMYGSQAYGQKAINRISPIALLNMNHALTLVGFQLRLSNEISGCYLLSAIQIGNKAGGTSLCFRGRMNIKTGRIGGCAGTNASTRLHLDTPRMLMAFQTETLELKVIPNALIAQEGDVEILFLIGGKTYKYKIPAKTVWDKGHKYVYSLIFDGKKISVENIKTSEWLPVTSSRF